MLDSNVILQSISLMVGAVNLGLVLKMLYNHLEHIKQDISKLHDLLIEHLRDHANKKDR